ncbi:MAG: N-6 DNA methylase [Acidaminococcaceae bacterium]|nr:N-6 DNA methylase [Acidaminococcaceae bacterium]
MKFNNAMKKVYQVFKGGNYPTYEIEKYAFATAVLMLLELQLFTRVIRRTAEAQQLEQAYKESQLLSNEEMKYLFRDCLKSAFRGGTFKAYEMFLVFQDDEQGLRDIVIGFADALGNGGSVSQEVNALALKILGKDYGDAADIVDYCSGDGVFLLQAYALGVAKNLYGQELNATGAMLTKLKLQALGCSTAEIITGDVLKNAAFLGKHSRVFTSFPLGLMKTPEIEAVECNYAGIATALRANAKRRVTPDWYFINILLNSLATQGKGVAIMRVTSLNNRAEAFIREQLIRDGMIEAVIYLGKEMLSNSKRGIALVVFSGGNTTAKLIDASQLIVDKDKRQGAAIPDIEAIYELYKQTESANKLCLELTAEQLVTKEYSLNYADYVEPLAEMGLPNTTRLEDVAILRRGIFSLHSQNDTSQQEAGKGDCLIAKVSNIVDGSLQDLQEAQLGNMKIVAKESVEVGDILLAAKGTMIKAALVRTKYKLPLLADQNIIVIRPNSRLIEPTYLLMLLNSKIGEMILRSTQIGDNLVSLSPGKVREIKVPLLDKEAQHQAVEQYNLVNTEVTLLQRHLATKQEVREKIIYQALGIEKK